MPQNVTNASYVTKSIKKTPKPQPTKKSKTTLGLNARILCTYYTSTYQEIHCVPSCILFIILVKSNDFSYISKSLLILKYNWTLPSIFLIRRSVSAFFMAFLLIMLDSFVVASSVELTSHLLWCEQFTNWFLKKSDNLIFFTECRNDVIVFFAEWTPHPYRSLQATVVRQGQLLTVLVFPGLSLQGTLW